MRSVTGPLGFEPRFEAPEASVMSKLYYGPMGATTVGRGSSTFRMILRSIMSR